jgi:hypothetical protein
VLNFARFEVLVVDFPDLFHPNTIDLRIGLSPQLILINHLLSQRPPTSLRKHRLHRLNLNPPLKIVLDLPLLGYPRIPRRHAPDRPFITIEHLSPWRPRKDIHSHFGRPLGHPLTQPPQRNHIIVAVVDG